MNDEWQPQQLDMNLWQDIVFIFFFFQRQWKRIFNTLGQGNPKTKAILPHTHTNAQHTFKWHCKENF